MCWFVGVSGFPRCSAGFSKDEREIQFGTRQLLLVWSAPTAEVTPRGWSLCSSLQLLDERRRQSTPKSWV